MDASTESETAPTKNRTTVEQTSDREIVVTRTFDAPVHLVFEAWTRPELFKQWWVPKSIGMTLLACELDVRIGGKYRLAFGNDPSNPVEFFGKYLDVIPNARIVWTNDEGGDSGPVTTVTFQESGGKTLLIVRDLYPSKEALIAGHGSEEAMPEMLDQLDELLRR
jgi:uncharacterized protein YndB with AHSA1/START domain